ncbi:MAG: c-type cytochrome [Candidatus Dadabacteria bacterium]|nr:c-type cytochrome [Candidatus Dadabacteria bacterium]NIQ14879.1 c-type cytochrome [Candidatus Dadabacteria bacterium]
MSENTEKIDEMLLEDHEYDGIKELDNPLPGWWLWTFYITIIFAVIYFYYYELGGGPSLDEQLQANLSEIYVEQEKAEKQVSEKTESVLLSYLENPEIIEQGKTEYSTKCGACHGFEGQGLIGPNLTDDYWIHGDGSILSIIDVATNGVVEKGMPSWKGLIKPELIEYISVYIKSINDTNPPGAKGPEGNLFK